MAHYFNMIMCVDSEWGLSQNNTLPWSNTPEGKQDMKWFKHFTSQPRTSVIMGRHTFNSLPAPLKGRVNIVLTKGPNIPDHPTFKTLDQALAYSFEQSLNPIVIGGLTLFEQSISHPLLKTIYITHLESSYNCDLFFPSYLLNPFNSTIINTKPLIKSYTIEKMK